MHIRSMKLNKCKNVQAIIKKNTEYNNKNGQTTTDRKNMNTEDTNDKSCIIKNESGISIGVITSGGDAPGMNSAIKAIIKMANKLNAEVYGIYNGFQGLIENKIKKFKPDDCDFDSLEGGTMLGTARSKEFETRDGRKTAVKNLLFLGINSLIIIGGGGSMRGSFTLWSEFSELRDELIAEKKINAIKKMKLKVVTIPGSIDNDVYGTESTLGADSAVNRVVETVDKLVCTMRSHRRILAVECMGNGCGWLAVASAVAQNGDYVIVPERRNVGWKDELRKSVNMSLKKKKKGVVIFLSEKSRDVDGKIISLEMIQETLKEHEVRMLCIGHIQRGGPTSGTDAVLGVLAGIKSVVWCVTGTHEAKMVHFSQERVELVDLEEVVVGTLKNDELKRQEDYDSLFERRSADYREMYCKFEEHRKAKIKFFEKEMESVEKGLEFKSKEEIKLERKMVPKLREVGPIKTELTLGKIEMIRKSQDKENIGMKSKDITNTLEKTSNPIKPLKLVVLNGTKIISGMNCFLNSVVQEGIYSGHKVYGCFDGFSGLKEIERSDLCEFSMFRNKDGCALGQGYEWNVNEIKSTVKKMSVDYLVVVGGNENLSVARNIESTIIVPACYENGLRGTAMTIGCDTALNTLIGIIKAYKQNVAVPGMVAIIEIGKEDSHYLHIMAGIACDVFAVLDGEKGCFCVYENTAEIIRNGVLGRKTNEEVAVDYGYINKRCNSNYKKKLEKANCHKEKNNYTKNIKDIKDIKDIDYTKNEKTILETLKLRIIAHSEKNKNAKFIILKHCNFYSQNTIKQVFSPDIEPVFISNVFGIAGEAAEPCFKDRVFANLAGIAIIRAINQNVGSGIIAYKNWTAEFKPIDEVTKAEKECKEEEWRGIFSLSN